ncbi:hypothetical protein OIU34_21005 [Pararhizobium sp. BT-229]|uniref:hypothetical protein n=1 Tax=Pararhizobium sp. BT-229 TaxID=2986923 RepID=UPI0021F7D953|nr:hypothetical protein [Pararhizobium sp. BT-229]MCV9964370.1 hypothetical protein [Pararhizobium sp. BT-229]
MSAEAGIGFHLDHSESEALRTWIGASASKIVLPHPKHVLSMEGAAEVEMTETNGHFHFSLSFDPATNVDDELTERATSLLTAMIDDAKRLLLWVPDYANEHSNFSAFFVHDSQGRTRVSSSILYSDPDFIILAANTGHEICMWYQPESEGKSGGLKSWDSRSIMSLKSAINKDAGAQRYVRNGLAARGMEEGTAFSFDGMGGVPSLIERRKEANKALLEGHTLEKHVDPAARIIYVDPDLVYLHAGFMMDYWIVYRREGLSEKRKFERAAGKRHADRAEKAMAEGAKPGNAFRKWAEKQDYEFDVAPHKPRN